GDPVRRPEEAARAGARADERPAHHPARRARRGREPDADAIAGRDDPGTSGGRAHVPPDRARHGSRHRALRSGDRDGPGAQALGGPVRGGPALPARARSQAGTMTRRRARAGTLSGGERQMLALAMAWMVEPLLLLLDEPSAGLAPSLQRLMFDRIREINARGLGILLVEQNARESLALCQRAYVLAMGRVRAEGAGGALRDDPEIRRLYLGG